MPQEPDWSARVEKELITRISTPRVVKDSVRVTSADTLPSPAESDLLEDLCLTHINSGYRLTTISL